mmetsp:Transcript_5893/g.8075  ORF Transcript_5893/g.8075 Transcript_5893/m.8075 type:complete len:81 (+) Transcript_5893:82-324(+)
MDHWKSSLCHHCLNWITPWDTAGGPGSWHTSPLEGESLSKFPMEKVSSFDDDLNRDGGTSSLYSKNSKENRCAFPQHSFF